MKFLDILGTASSNMFRSKLRTSLTIIAIFIGAFTLTLTNGLGSGISTYIDKQVGNLGAKDLLIITPAGDDNGIAGSDPKKYDPSKKTASIESEGNRTVTVFTDADLKKIKAIDGIKSTEAVLYASVDYIAASSTKYLIGLDTYIPGTNLSLDAGHQPVASSTNREVLIPSTYLSSLGFKDAQSALGKTVQLGVTNGLGKQTEVPATIIGVLQKSLTTGSSMSVNTPLLTELRRVQYQGLPATATTTFQAATARFDNTMPEAKVTELKDRLKKAGYTAKTIEDQIGTFKAVINGVVAVLNGFAVIALLAASFGIINTLLMSVQERTKEIGLMKAMGMGSGRIFLLFSLEATMLGLWGSLLGVLAAIGAGTIINKIVLNTFLKDLEGLQLLAFPPMSIAAIVGIVMVVAFLAGTLPAIRAARQNPIDSLRYE